MEGHGGAGKPSQYLRQATKVEERGYLSEKIPMVRGACTIYCICKASNVTRLALDLFIGAHRPIKTAVRKILIISSLLCVFNLVLSFFLVFLGLCKWPFVSSTASQEAA